MAYQISRNGQMYGPYTLDDLQRYLASGNVLGSDLAKSEDMPEWLPVSQILAAAGVAGPAAAPSYTVPVNPGPVYEAPSYAAAAASQNAALAASPYQDSPNLHWGLVLLFSFLTCWFFMLVWNLVVNAWLKRVQPNATSLFYYAGAYGLLAAQMLMFHSTFHHTFMTGMHTHTDNPIGGLLAIMVWVIRLIARYSQRASLEEHFNGPEPVGLQLSPVMTFFFGGVYFQYKLNEINAIKMAARYRMLRPY